MTQEIVEAVRHGREGTGCSCVTAVQAALERRPEVRSALVVHDDGQDTSSIAVLVVDGYCSPPDVHTDLRGDGFGTCVPSTIVLLDQAADDPSAHADPLAVLVDADPGEAGVYRYAEPANDDEVAVAQIWERTLGRAGIGVLDDFLESGGNSLDALAVARQIGKRYHVPFEPTALFELGNIRAVAQEVAARQASQE
jgi:hypothetical protein